MQIFWRTLHSNWLKQRPTIWLIAKKSTFGSRAGFRYGLTQGPNVAAGLCLSSPSWASLWLLVFLPLCQLESSLAPDFPAPAFTVGRKSTSLPCQPFKEKHSLALAWMRSRCPFESVPVAEECSGSQANPRSHAFLQGISPEAQRHSFKGSWLSCPKKGQGDAQLSKEIAHSTEQT